jgi:hypothetical protein
MQISNFQALKIKKATVTAAYNGNRSKTLMAQKRDATEQSKMMADLNDQMFTPQKISRLKIWLLSKELMKTMALRADSVFKKENQIKRESSPLIQSFFKILFPFLSECCSWREQSKKLALS